MAAIADQEFWPAHRQLFDFTFKFEEIVFGLLLSSCVLVLALWLCWSYTRRPACVRQNALLYAKLAFVAALCSTQVASVAVWATAATGHRTSTTLPAVVLDLVAAFAVGALTYTEHLYSVGSSSLFSIYLLATLLTDVTRSRTFFLRGGLDAAGSLAAAAAALRLFLVGLREVSKKWLLIDDRLRCDIGPEATSGFLSKLLFLFARRMLAIGFRTRILNDDLNHLDPEFSPRLLHTQLTNKWRPRQHGNAAPRHSLVRACLNAWKRCFLELILWRLTLTAFNFSQPFILRRVIEFIGQPDDEISKPETEFGLLGAASIVFYGIAVARAVFAHGLNRFITRLRGGLIALIFYKEHKLIEAQAKKAAAATLMSADVDGIATGMPRCLEIPIGMFEIALGTYMLSTFTGLSALAVLAPMTITTITAYLIGLRMSSLFAAWNKSIEIRVAKTSRILSQLTGIKALGLGPTIAHFLQRLRIDEIQTSKAFRRMQALNMVPAELGDLITPAVVIAALVFGTSFGVKLEAAKVFPILTVVSLIQRPLLVVLQSFATVSSMLACFSRIQDYLSLPDWKDSRTASSSTPNSDESRPSIPQQSNGIISFHNADIAPYGMKEALLHNVNFQVSRGSITAVIGLTGSGKSTLLHGILGASEVLAGSVKVATTDIAYCGQTVWLRNTSIRENIIGHLPYDRAKFLRVIRACFLEEDLQWLPGGEEYVVGTNGANLSGGQRQRVAIARTAYSECTVVVLDDAFSSLDSDTAITILYQLCGTNGLFRQAGCTALVATYLPDCMQLADQAIYIDDRGSATLKSMQQISQYADRLVAALSIVNTNASLIEETRDLDSLRRSLDASAPATSDTVDDVVRKRTNLSIYSIFLRPIGWVSSTFYACLVSFSAATEIMPEIYIRIWIEVDPTNKTFFVGYISVIAVTCITALLHYWLLYTKLCPRASAGLHKDLVQATLGSTLRFVSTTKTGSLVNLFSQDMTLISRDLPAACLGVVYAVSNSLCNVGLVLSGATYLSCVIPVLLLALFFIQRYYLRTSRQVRLLDLEMKAPLYTYFEETAAGLMHIQAFKWEDENIQRGFAMLQESQKPYYALLTIQQWLRLVLGLVNATLGTLLVAVAIFSRHSSSQSSIGLAFMGLIFVSSSLELTIDMWTRLETSSGALERISSFRTRTPQETSRSQKQLPQNWPSKGQVEFRNVSAYYSDDADAPPGLDDVSLAIHPGQRIGVAGRSGSGKSTLLMTMLGFLKYQGKLEIDGVDVSSVSRDDLRSRLITITQDQIVFDADIRTNLLPFTMNDGVGTPDGDEKAAQKDLELEQLLKDLHIWAPLAKKGDLDATLDDVGYSKGQLQLLCIARAILRHRETGYSVILVDEATSSVDGSTEAIVHRVMRDNFRDCTVLTVAHRQSSLTNVDAIVRLHRGALLTSASQRDESDSSDEDA
ncbi:hypothetical protein V2A60_000257 [Cordyceps javanica]